MPEEITPPALGFSSTFFASRIATDTALAARHEIVKILGQQGRRNMNRIKSFALAIQCCLLLLCTGAIVSAQVDETNNLVPVEIRLKPDKQTYMLGEPLFIVFEVTNVSGEKLCLGVGADYRNKFGRPDSFSVSVTSHDGVQVPKLEVSNMGGFIGCDPIEPGETYSVRLFLPHWVTIERTGSYRANVKRRMAFSGYDPAGKTSVKYSMLADVSAAFTIVPSDRNKMGAVIASLGSVMLDASDAMSAESAKALFSIHDERVISYFSEALRKFRDYEFGFEHLRESWICSTAIAALATYNDDRAIEALEAAMKSPNESTRERVATAFADSPHPSAIKLLLKMQDDGYWFVRLRVAQGLEKVKTKESQAVLRKFLKDENEDVRKAANESLKEK